MRKAGRRERSYAWLCGWVALLSGALMLYSQASAFAWDEGFHLLAAQLIGAGRLPYIDFCYPQTPLWAYTLAAWMRIFGEGWRAGHALSALLTAGAALLVADYVFLRLPASRWRLPGAISAALLTALNGTLFEHATLAQAYGACLFAIVAAFRAAVAGRGNRLWMTALAGCFAAAAAASSLLTAATVPVLLVWIAAGSARWRRIAAFLAGAALPFLPLVRLFVHGPRQTLFNVFQYQLFFRTAGWTDPTGHDLDVLTSWIDRGDALLLAFLAAAGLLYVRAEKSWDRAGRSELYLCGWMALALGLEVATAHPTFPQYFLVVVPFLAILAGVGLYGIGSRFGGSVRPIWPVAALAGLALFGLGRDLYERRDVYTWSDIEQIARKVNEVAPAQATVWADESVYFLTRRKPVSGAEFAYSHAIETLPPERAAELHILPHSELASRVRAGAYDAIETCDDDSDFIQSLNLSSLYRRRAEVAGCAVYWEKLRR